MSKNYHLFDLIWFAICNFLFLITTTCQNEIRRVGERDLYRVTLNLGEWYPRCSHPRLQGRSERAQNKISPKNLKTSITFHSHPTQCCMHKNHVPTGRAGGDWGRFHSSKNQWLTFTPENHPVQGMGGDARKIGHREKEKRHFFSGTSTFFLWHLLFFLSGTSFSVARWVTLLIFCFPLHGREGSSQLL